MTPALTSRQPSTAAPADAAAPGLSELFQQHADFVWRGLRRLGIAEADADDALQEVFLVVARRLPEYSERGTMRAWLFCIARQVALHARRGQARRLRREHEGAARERTVADPHHVLEQKQAAALVQRILDELKEPQAMVLYLADIEELSAPEVAAALGVPLSTVHGRLRLARARFEQLLRQHRMRTGGGP